ncbi:hypothetical protein [Geminicoccus roseus]|uniref:hypothetical protein n=1 Tax=Geminicoccus roseus TaxID=404900 RepID=UPI000429C74C|nr:hypothetical protein [Geminicoccus roseus]
MSWKIITPLVLAFVILCTALVVSLATVTFDDVPLALRMDDGRTEPDARPGEFYRIEADGRFYGPLCHIASQPPPPRELTLVMQNTIGRNVPAAVSLASVVYATEVDEYSGRAIDQLPFELRLEGIKRWKEGILEMTRVNLAQNPGCVERLAFEISRGYCVVKIREAWSYAENTIAFDFDPTCMSVCSDASCAQQEPQRPPERPMPPIMSMIKVTLGINTWRLEQQTALAQP